MRSLAQPCPVAQVGAVHTGGASEGQKMMEQAAGSWGPWCLCGATGFKVQPCPSQSLTWMSEAAPRAPPPTPTRRRALMQWPEPAAHPKPQVADVERGALVSQF